MDGCGLHIRLELKLLTAFQFRSPARFKIISAATGALFAVEGIS